MLVLDLDETLIHTCSLKDHPDIVLQAQPDEESVAIPIPLKLRPFLGEFLQRMAEVYEIIVYTASADYYAQAIIRFLDPGQEIISGLLTRQNCMETKNGFVIKDLRIIRNFGLDSIVMVDNLAHSFGLQIDNGVPILEFTCNHNDRELKYLADYLVELSKAVDVREYNQEHLKLKKLSEMKEYELFPTS
jgi:CTD small phosphatase-like protein 2